MLQSTPCSNSLPHGAQRLCRDVINWAKQLPWGLLPQALRAQAQQHAELGQAAARQGQHHLWLEGGRPSGVGGAAARKPNCRTVWFLHRADSMQHTPTGILSFKSNEPPTWSSRFSNVTVPRREMPSLPTTTCGSAVRRGAA